MSSINMLELQDDIGYKLITILPVVVVIAAVAFVLKLSVQKSKVTKKSQPLNVKKQQKVTKNKQKEEILNDKKSKKKNASPSTAKNIDGAASDTVRSKPNKKQENAIEKPLKKTVQSKKQQVVENNVKKSAKSTPSKKQTDENNQLRVFVSKEEEGEWQMVTTKKQSKHEDIIESTTPSKSNKRTPEKTNKTSKTKKVKVANVKNYIPTPFFNGEVTPTEIRTVVKSEPLVQGQADEIAIFSKDSPIQLESPVPESFTSNTVVSTDTVEVNTVNAQSTSSANVAFDELGDDGWTDNKPQKKNRRKALRE